MITQPCPTCNGNPTTNFCAECGVKRLDTLRAALAQVINLHTGSGDDLIESLAAKAREILAAKPDAATMSQLGNLLANKFAWYHTWGEVATAALEFCGGEVARLQAECDQRRRSVESYREQCERLAKERDDARRLANTWIATAGELSAKLAARVEPLTDDELHGVVTLWLSRHPEDLDTDRMWALNNLACDVAGAQRKKMEPTK